METEICLVGERKGDIFSRKDSQVHHDIVTICRPTVDNCVHLIAVSIDDSVKKSSLIAKMMIESRLRYSGLVDDLLNADCVIPSEGKKIEGGFEYCKASRFLFLIHIVTIPTGRYSVNLYTDRYRDFLLILQ